MSQNLLEPVLDGAVRSVAFFNGRLLSAEDLRQDRDATREFLRRLGRAGGDGVAFGFDVSEAVGQSSPQVPVVTVTPGVAVNRSGHALALTAPADIRLVVPPPETTPATAGDFDDCPRGVTPPPAGDAGLFVLTVGPARSPEGRVPVSGLAAAVATCNTRYTVEGVQFRLVPLPLTVADLSDPDRLRHDAAYRCLGLTSDAYTARFRDPFGIVSPTYGLIDQLRQDKALTDCEVPLALIRLTATGIGFIDAWAVRRRVAAPAALTAAGPGATDRRAAEGEAMIAQFRDHTRDVLSRSKSPAAEVADTYFRFLPPAGLLPVRSPNRLTGFDADTFFAGRAATDPDVIDGGQLPELFREAALHAPIPLVGPDGSGVDVAIQVYFIRENLAQAADSKVQRALVFTSRAIRFRGLARFGHAHWGFDNFAPLAG